MNYVDCYNGLNINLSFDVRSDCEYPVCDNNGALFIGNCDIIEGLESITPEYIQILIK